MGPGNLSFVCSAQIFSSRNICASTFSLFASYHHRERTTLTSLSWHGHSLYDCTFLKSTENTWPYVRKQLSVSRLQQRKKFSTIFLFSCTYLTAIMASNCEVNMLHGNALDLGVFFQLWPQHVLSQDCFFLIFFSFTVDYNCVGEVGIYVAHFWATTTSPLNAITNSFSSILAEN